jgi:hypothetical protein
VARKGIDIEPLKEEPEILLNFMREMRKAAFYNSNIFFRDVQFILRDYFEAEEEATITTDQAERYAFEILEAWSQRGVVRQVNKQAYLLLHKEYLTPKEGTIGLLNVRIDDLPASAIPFPKGMARDATAIAPTPVEEIERREEDKV